jgi:hypothetical protein
LFVIRVNGDSLLPSPPAKTMPFIAYFLPGIAIETGNDMQALREEQYAARVPPLSLQPVSPLSR